MTLDQYLERFVEGYLFEDLRSMAAVRLPAGKECGGVGYPMVATTCAGIELLGVLTSSSTFTGWKGDQRFRDYWQRFLYPHHSERQAVANAIYDLVRHGLAHTYTPKPSFVVTKGLDGRHMCRQDDFFFIDALSFADELIDSYNNRVRPRLADIDFKTQMNERFTDLRKVYREDYENLKSVLHQAPTTAAQPSTSFLGVPNSPSGVRIEYSTNTSTKNPLE